jgi:hypothetical protein
LTVVPDGRFWPVSAWRLTTAPAELRTWVTSVRLAAPVMPLFVKSTVTFVDVPVADGLGEIPCNEMLAGDDEDNGPADDDGDNGLADDDGLADAAGDNGLADDEGAADDEALADDDGVADDDALGDDDGVADDDAFAGVAVTGEGCPFTLTANDLVARPWPPCHISKPASTSIRYQDGLIQPRLIASAIRGCRSRLVTEVVPVFIV